MIQTPPTARSEGAAVIDKILDVVEFIASAEDGSTPAEISERLGLPRPTVYRLVSVLSRRGYLASGSDRRLRVGLKFLQIGGRVPVAELARAAGRPILWDLLKATGCASAQIAVLDHGVAVFVERTSQSGSAFKFDRRPGDEVPLHCTALGMAVLAALPDGERDSLLDGIAYERRAPNTPMSREAVLSAVGLARRNGYAVSVAEYADDVWSVAAPFAAAEGAPPLAIGISEHMWRYSPQRLQEVATHVKAAAARMALAIAEPPDEPETRSEAV
jgi:IclR family acetate operon transcriptional repressor